MVYLHGTRFRSSDELDLPPCVGVGETTTEHDTPTAVRLDDHLHHAATQNVIPCPTTIVTSINAHIVGPGLTEFVAGVPRFRSAPFHRKAIKRPCRTACRTTRSRLRSGGECRRVPHGTSNAQQQNTRSGQTSRQETNHDTPWL